MLFRSNSNPLSFVLFILILVVSLSGCRKNSGNNILSVGKKGTLNRIEVPSNPTPVAEFAALELQKYLEEISGIKLEVIKAGEGKEESGAIRLLVDENADVQWDGFKINADNGDIAIRAREQRGLLYGAYQLLEEAGCSFVYPGKQEEVVPQKEIVEFISGERIFNPAIEQRGLTPYGLQASSLELSRNFIDWMAKNKLNYILVSEDRRTDCPGSAHSSILKEVGEELLPELQKRGFVIEMAEHTIDIFFSRSLFQEHPEWFALIRGERRIGDENDPYTGQMCYSNKEAVEYYAKAVADYAAKRPEFHIIGTWPRDGGQWCECNNCESDPEVLYHAIEVVAEKVKKVRPDISVEYMIYPRPKGFQPPPEKLPENMSFLWIPDNGELDSLGRQWSVKSNREARGTYQFEYLMGDNYRSRANVWLNPSLAVNNAVHARNMEFKGVTSLFLPLENWWRAAFNNWFFARACWNTELDIDASLHEYCTKYYGNVASDTEVIFHRIFNNLQADQSIMIYSPKSDNPDKYTATVTLAANIIEQLDAVIDKSQEPEVTERLSRLRAYVEYYRLFYEGMLNRNEKSLAILSAYSKNHPEFDMVLMAPEYIEWRNSELFK